MNNFFDSNDFEGIGISEVFNRYYNYNFEIEYCSSLNFSNGFEFSEYFLENTECSIVFERAP